MSIRNILIKINERVLCNEGIVILCFLVFGVVLKSVFIFNSVIWQNDTFYYIQGAKTMVDGGALYRDFGDIKAPGIFVLHFLLIKMFGYNHIFISIKAFVILCQTLTSYLVYRIGFQLWDRKTGFNLGMLFLLLISLDVELWQENVMLFTLLPISVAVYFLLRDGFCFQALNILISGFFIGLSFILSTNTIVYTLLYPVLGFGKTRSLKEATRLSVLAFVGFIIPVIFAVYYLFHNEVLSDALWWNFIWASVYARFWSVMRLVNFLYAMVRNWEWIPLFVVMFFAMKSILKEKLASRDFTAYTVLVLGFVGILARLLLQKSAVRYNLYFLPGGLLLIPFARLAIRSSMVKITFALVLFTGLSVTIFDTVKNPPYHQLEKRPELYRVIQQNTRQSDKIFVWPEGYEIYYCSKRSMATSIFAPFQHLYPPFLKKEHAKILEHPWETFLSQLSRERPAMIIDLTGTFDAGENNPLQKQIDAYRARMISFISEHYNESQSIGETHMWILKK